MKSKGSYLDHNCDGDESLRFVAGLRRVVVQLGVVAVKLDLCVNNNNNNNNSNALNDAPDQNLPVPLAAATRQHPTTSNYHQVGILRDSFEIL